MKINYGLSSEFECVYLVNGAFREQADSIVYPADSALYITLLPLKATLLPYTVKIVGAEIINNIELAEVFEFSPDHLLIKFKQRHNYVYTASMSQTLAQEKGTAVQLFNFVKRGEIQNARRLMTRELSDSIDDEALSTFFEPYSTILENKFTDLEGSYYLIEEQSKKGEEIGRAHV